MTRRDDLAEARRHVLRGAADLLRSALGNGDAWLYSEGDPSDEVIALREKATHQLADRLMKQARKKWFPATPRKANNE